mmetsp:Transcript_1346/g.3615  ORF Transcript_1346/g.3615 Transcript_1346/m.3615 type:complete len:657 (+) Transcript_1346:152-2122(+)
MQKAPEKKARLSLNSSIPSERNLWSDGVLANSACSLPKQSAGLSPGWTGESPRGSPRRVWAHEMPGLDANSLLVKLLQQETAIRQTLDLHAQRVEDILEEAQRRQAPRRMLAAKAAKHIAGDGTNSKSTMPSTGVASANYQAPQVTRDAQRAPPITVQETIESRSEDASRTLDTSETSAADGQLTTPRISAQPSQWAVGTRGVLDWMGVGPTKSDAPVAVSKSYMVQEMGKLHDAAEAAMFNKPRQGCIASWSAHFVHTTLFALLVSLNVVINVWVAGSSADYRIRHSLETLPLWIQIANVATTVLFVTEITLRIVASGRDFFRQNSANAFWNYVDLLLVCSALVQTVASCLSRPIISLSTLRVLTLGRLIRYIPHGRVQRSVADLRVMLLSITHGLGSVLWASVVLAFVMSLIAVCIMECLVPHMTDADSLASNEVLTTELSDKWGSAWKALYTIYMCISGGLDWGEAADPLFEVNSFLGFLFCLFIAFAQLCLLNVMTGVFVENAARITQRDEDSMLLHELEHRREWVKQVVQVFDKTEHAASGSMTKEEFKSAMKDVRIQALLSKLGIDIHAHRPESLFALFDHDHDGNLEIEEFASALQHFHGQARSVDVAKLRWSVKKLHTHMRELHEALSQGSVMVGQWSDDTYDTSLGL